MNKRLVARELIRIAKDIDAGLFGFGGGGWDDDDSRELLEKLDHHLGKVYKKQKEINELYQYPTKDVHELLNYANYFCKYFDDELMNNKKDVPKEYIKLYALLRLFKMDIEKKVKDVPEILGSDGDKLRKLINKLY